MLSGRAGFAIVYYSSPRRGPSEPSPGAPLVEVGHRRPFFRRHVVDYNALGLGGICYCLLFLATPGAKRAVPGRAISTLPPRRDGAPTPVLSPTCRSAAVRMGRGGTARPPEAEWSSGVTAFVGEVFRPRYFKDPKKRHDHLSVVTAFVGEVFRPRYFKDAKKRHDHLSVLYNKDKHLGWPSSYTTFTSHSPSRSALFSEYMDVFSGRLWYSSRFGLCVLCEFSYIRHAAVRDC